MSVMKFCGECNNVLYPKENREESILLFACRNCSYQEVAEDSCVYKMEINHSVGERSRLLQDAASDPALPRTRNVRCSNCNHPEAVFFQDKKRFSGFSMFKAENTSEGFQMHLLSSQYGSGVKLGLQHELAKAFNHDG
ncbi:hypothetical protein ZIOFF_050681 [Zingiber officinale]|uniref:DNA-directed RNA polymerase II subunit RPB9-like zinc ribbon domain-containing protein n=1 Tax=Zingiber officinale TaxID=94328 RepID=A0A8J5FJ94_ZINOF|nr:hypothetical protein ZIOFF_050681 [Zingiber officinale]